MIAMFILAIVCVAWLEIIGIQSARREARRREAVERLAGMMDAFMDLYRDGYDAEGNYIEVAAYRENKVDQTLSYAPEYDADLVLPVFSDNSSPIGYQLRIIEKDELKEIYGWSTGDLNSWGDYYWLIGELYDRNGTLAEAGAPFFSVCAYLGYDEDH